MSSATNGHNSKAGEMFGQAARSFEAAMQSGLRLQEESVKFITEMLSDVGSPQKWQKKAQAVIQDVVGASQKNLDEAAQLANENAKISLGMLQKAFDASPTDTAEAQSKTMEMWETTLGILRKNTEAVLRANGRLVETWTEVTKKISGEQMERMMRAAQEATQKTAEAAGAK